MSSCACPECMTRNGPTVGQQVYLKPERIAIEGTLPPDLAEPLKAKPFKVLKLDNSKGAPSAALEMPSGVGVQMKVDSKMVWAWFVWNTDIYSDEKPAEKKGAIPTASSFKAGDIVKTTSIRSMDANLSAKQHNEGFRVLGKIDKDLIVELPGNLGDTKRNYGKHTNIIPISQAVMVRDYKCKVGDYVRVLNTFRSYLAPSLNDQDHSLGFQILDIESSGTVVLSLPDSKGNRNPKFPGKTTNVINIDQIELAPEIKFRPGAKVLVHKSEYGYLPSRLSEAEKQQEMEVLGIKGDVGYLEYLIKFPDGTTAYLSEQRLIESPGPVETKQTKDSVEEGKMSKKKLKTGMKVKIKKSCQDSLPDSLSESAKDKSFEIVSIDDESIGLKMPARCEDADYYAEYGGRVWFMDQGDLETNMASTNKRGTAMERITANVEQGAVKAVGRKITKVAKAGILSALERVGRANGMGDGEVSSGLKMVTALMETESGAAVLSTVIGLALQHGAPHIPFPIFQDERVQDLADEMSSEGIAVVMEKVFDIGLTHISPVLGEIFEGLPPKKEVKKVRIKTETAPKRATSKKPRVVDHEEDHEEDEKHAETKTRTRAA